MAVFGFYEDDPPPTYRTLPHDFFLFLKMKLKLKGQCYDSTEQIHIKSQNVMKKLPQNDSLKCFLS
jgi:hypothetical protein